MMNDSDKRKLQLSDVVSFDVFDTLLARKTAHPTDVFKIAHELFNERSPYVITEDFWKIRVEAEKTARKITNNVDVTFHEIYDVIQEIKGYSTEIIKELMKYELQAEESLLVRDQSSLEIYDLAKKSNKTIAIVTDMYLPRVFIEKILHKNGINNWDILILSCEDGVGKYCGSAFAKLISIYPNKKITHVGDNEWSDIAWSTAFGIENIHKHKNIEKLSFEAHPTYRAVFGGDRYRFSEKVSRKTISDIQFNVTSGMTANYLAGQNRTVAQSIGYGIFGPALLGLVQWIDRTSRELNVNHIYYLARDGAIIQKAYEAYFADQALPSTYMFGSRRLFNFPNIFNVIGHTELNTLTETDRELDIKKTLMYFGLDPEDGRIKEAFKRVGLSVSQRVQIGPDMERVKAALLLVADIIVETAEIERERLLEYFSSISFTDKNVRPAICDVGWHGSMQISINNLTKKEIPGLYFGLHNDEKPKTLGALAHAYFDFRDEGQNESHPNRVVNNGIEVIEYLFTNPNQGTLVGIAQDERGKFIPVEGQFDNEEKERVLLEDIQKSSLQFISDFKELSDDMPKSILNIDREAAFRALDWAIEKPSDAIAELIGSVHHSYSAASVPRLIGMPLYDKSYYRKNADALSNELQHAFWRQGFLKNVERMSLQKYLS